MIEIKMGDLYCTLETKDKNLINRVRNNLKYENDIFARQRSMYVQKYSYLMDKRGKFYTGLIDNVTRMLRALDVAYTIEDNRTSAGTPSEEEMVRRLKRLNVTPREYQWDCIFKGLEYTRAMFDLCTGSGKTIVMASLALAWGKKTLIVCNSTDLAQQLQEDFAAITGERVGLIGAGVFDPQYITVGMVSTLRNKKASKAKKQKIKEYCESVEYMMYDEVHHSQAKTWRDVAKMCKNASIRQGFSGTCFSSEATMEDGSRVSNKDIMLNAYTGPIVAQIKTADLVALGYLSKPTVTMIRNTVHSDSAKMAHADEYERIIMDDPVRSDIAAQIAKETYDKGEQTIVFVDRIRHGEDLAAMLIEKYGVPSDDIGFVHGEGMSKFERKELIANFRMKSLPIIIGTVLGEGLNFFAKVGINLAGGRSKKNTIQRIGRVLRKEADPMTGDVDTSIVACVDYYDFCDLKHPWFKKHSAERMKTYREEGHQIRFMTVDREMSFDPKEALSIKGDRRKEIYDLFTSVYKEVTGLRWSWKTGEKQRVVEAFILFAEGMGIREDAKYIKVLDKFGPYLHERIKIWLNWDKASRQNFLPLVFKKEDCRIYTARISQTLNDKTQLAGTITNEEWEF